MWKAINNCILLFHLIIFKNDKIWLNMTFVGLLTSREPNVKINVGERLQNRPFIISPAAPGCDIFVTNWLYHSRTAPDTAGLIIFIINEFLLLIIFLLFC